MGPQFIIITPAPCSALSTFGALRSWTTCCLVGIPLAWLLDFLAFSPFELFLALFESASFSSVLRASRLPILSLSLYCGFLFLISFLAPLAPFHTALAHSFIGSVPPTLLSARNPSSPAVRAPFLFFLDPVSATNRPCRPSRRFPFCLQQRAGQKRKRNAKKKG